MRVQAILDQALQTEAEDELPAAAQVEDTLSESARVMLAELDAIRTRPLTMQERIRWSETRRARENAFQHRKKLRREWTVP